MSKPEENKSLYSVRRSQSNLPLSSNLRHAAYYKEVLINNDTGVTLYFLTAGDTALKSVPTLTQHAFTRTLTIKEIVREVIVDKHGFTKDVSDPRDRVLSEYSIKLDDLMDHPVFVREFGVVIWRMNDVEVMRKYHPLAIDNYNKYVEDAIKTSLNECVSNPMRFLINIHKPERGGKKDNNWKHRTMFVIVNGRVLACKVSNIPSIEEGMWFTARIADFDNSESLVTYSVTGDNFQKSHK